MLFANPISCSILDNEYTIIFNTFARIRSGLIEYNVFIEVLRKAPEPGKYACVDAVD